MEVESGRLVVTSGEHEIGNWAVEELSVRRRHDEFLIRVEGEELVVAGVDAAGFSDGLGIKDRRLPGAGKAGGAKRSRRAGRSGGGSQEPTGPQTALPPPGAPSVASETVEAPDPEVVSRVPLRWKLAGLGAAGLVVLGVLATSFLALLLVLSGVVMLLLAIAATGDAATPVRPPPFFGTPAAIAGGIAMVVVGIALFLII